MFMSLISHLLSAWFAFFLPCFGTWKALSQSPIPEAEIQKWGMYWSVVGAFVAFEYIGEWLVSWFPFYWETKTVILLFLALPQTQGSTWVYQTYLAPFFAKNEDNINASIAAAQSNILTFLQTRVTMLWDAILHNVSQAASAAPQNGSAAPGAPGAQQPAAGSPLGFVQGLWKSYGPAAVGALQQYANAAQSTSAMAANVAPPQPPAAPVSATATGYDVTPQHSQPVTPAAAAEAGSPPFPEPKLY